MSDDLTLLTATADAWPRVRALALATSEVLKRDRAGDARALRTVGEVVTRFETVALNTLEYHDGMSEADLRAWAKRMVGQ